MLDPHDVRPGDRQLGLTLGQRLHPCLRLGGRGRRPFSPFVRQEGEGDAGLTDELLGRAVLAGEDRAVRVGLGDARVGEQADSSGLRGLDDVGVLGDPLTGAEAVEWGIANAVLPAAEVLNHARRMAERFNSLAPSAVRASKKLMREPGLAELQRVIQTEAEIFGARLRSPEAMEAFQAFFQKRAPDFSKFE